MRTKKTGGTWGKPGQGPCNQSRPAKNTQTAQEKWDWVKDKGNAPVVQGERANERKNTTRITYEEDTKPVRATERLSGKQVRRAESSAHQIKGGTQMGMIGATRVQRGKKRLSSIKKNMTPSGEDVEKTVTLVS